MLKTSNSQLESLPTHLKQYIKDQDYSGYTAIDQAVWRYVMRINVNHLTKVAHESYLSGLQKAGLEIDNIAHMYGMNRILQEIGWAAVAVDGFIPPSAFMEFQAYNVLVIAADIRQLNHIEYTPAPDIIHEAAGHAPIIADPEYAEYLRLFGEIGSKAISSAKDFELYEAIRHLSIIKEYPFTPPENIEAAEKKIEAIQANMGEPSEMALIRRLHWWTVEYGLIGDVDNPKIYGAGLLSSIGESVTCLKPEVKKLPYTIDAVNYEFDITKVQPQLFVTPDFSHLTKVLLEFSETMAMKRGGAYGINLAIESGNISTCVLDSGLQISGVFDKVIMDNEQNPVWITTKGSTALAENNIQLPEGDKNLYRDGFSVLLQHPDDFNDALNELKLLPADEYELFFKSGIKLNGKLETFIEGSKGQILGVKFLDVKIEIPNDDTYIYVEFILTIGNNVISVYSGAADKNAFNEKIRIPAEGTYKVNYDSKSKRLQELYQDVRTIRTTSSDIDKLESIFQKIQKDYPDDWLLSLEIYELLKLFKPDDELTHQVLHHLEVMKLSHPPYEKLITDGLDLIHSDNIIKIPKG
jgi:phenylalanine-4-hydroxylase